MLPGFLTVEERESVAHEAIVADGTAGGIGLTATLVQPTSGDKRPRRSAYISFETAPCRWTIDGTAPTSTVGHLASAGEAFTIYGSSLGKFRAIRTTGTSADIHVTYFV